MPCISCAYAASMEKTVLSLFSLHFWNIQQQSQTMAFVIDDGNGYASPAESREGGYRPFAYIWTDQAKEMR